MGDSPAAVTATAGSGPGPASTALFVELPHRFGAAEQREQFVEPSARGEFNTLGAATTRDGVFARTSGRRVAGRPFGYL
ncbi:hypothetical protein HUT06_33015 [Actinomadura sp. NAK00032]|uniref:hypothetical protein n=1 Tax=Actinomadura sp. NAK00032 TaxID=2742128 RepID=UPI00158FB8CF|nr:hypothetical protein [Actinomadura sp. NAK00032]QKW38232.1 hypothetical protein HUT06_33015 [Actinomadura sp. NAK00032]